MNALRSLLALVALLFTTSCLEREEVIVVSADGSVTVSHRVKGQPGDLDGGAAHYPTGSPYRTTRTLEDEGTDDEKVVLTAVAGFPSLADVPDTFAPSDVEFPDAQLRFPTQTWIEERDDGPHHFWVRRYQPREWARYQYHYDNAFHQEVRDLMERGPLESLEREERLRILVAITEYERGKNLEWAQSAIETLVSAPGRQVSAVSAARSAIERFLAKNAKPEQLDELLRQPEATILARARELQADLDARIVAAILDAAPSEGILGAEVLRALSRARTTFEVTEDLEDETFTVRLEIPGRIVAHNADTIEDGIAIWQFEGKELRDRKQTLMLEWIE